MSCPLRGLTLCDGQVLEDPEHGLTRCLCSALQELERGYESSEVLVLRGELQRAIELTTAPPLF